MIKRLLVFILFLGITFNLISQTSTTEGDKIIGVWLTGKGNAHIKITKYGNKYGGKIVWLKIPNRPDGTEKKDDKNPDKAKQTVPLLGLDNLLGFTYEGKKSYENGTIYDPENGKTYSCAMTLEDENHLNVRGYIGIQLFGRTDKWTRVIE